MLPVVLGTANFGTYVSKERSFELLDMFVALGGYRLDTSNNYACWHPEGKGGESESVIGEWLKARGRDKASVMTKIGALSMDGISYKQLDGLSADNIKRSVDKCLLRLQTDYIDTLFAHVDDHNTPLEETWQTLTELVRQGVVGQLGISNYAAERILELDRIIVQQELEPVSHAQYRYSIVTPNADADFSPQIVLNENLHGSLKKMSNVPEIMAYSPLVLGCFDNDPDELPEQYDNLINAMIVDEVQQVAKKLDVSGCALVLKRIHEHGITPITSTSSPARLEQNLKLFIDEEES